MVAAHAFDLRSAAKVGMHTFYVHREKEEKDSHPELIKSKDDGGEFDIVASSFLELNAMLSKEH